MKLSTFLQNYNVTSTGFPAIAGLGDYSKGDKPAVLSSLSPAILYAQGVTDFYALEIPRGSVFKTSQDIIDADLPVRRYRVFAAEIDGLDTVIVSQHRGTVDILLQTYPDAPVFASVSAEDIAGKHVIGTLPPSLITAVAAYTAVTIRDFDHAKDGDLSGQELLDRLVIADNAIKVDEV